MKRTKRHGISTGTIFMLTLTCLVLIGFLALLPKLTGTTSISTNAIDLAVKLDASLSQLMGSAQDSISTAKPAGTSLKPLTTVAPTPTPAPTVPPIKQFTLCAAGSIQMDANSLSSLKDKETGYRFDYLLGAVGDAMQSDLTIATLRNSVIPSKETSGTNMPTELLTALKNAGIDAVNLGHLTGLNAGVKGLIETKDSIVAAGMTPFGMYTSPEERSAPVIGTTNGVNIGLLSYLNDLSSAGKKQLSGDERSYAYAPLDVEAIKFDIKALREKGAEVVIVHLCWGKSNASSPTKEQRETAQQIADAGADIILGNNPQAVFPIELLTAQRGDGQYHPVLCAYSMGNLFTFDRENRANLSGILLRADIQYDSATKTIAFDNLTYDPTYCWRDKVDDKIRTGVVLADPADPPAFLEQKQQNVMERCYNLIKEVMSGTVLKER